MIVDAAGEFRAIQRVAQAQGLKLQVDEDCKQPYTDMINKTVYVPRLFAYHSPDKLMLWRGYTYHEVGHHAPELQDLVPLVQEKGISCESLFFRVINILEDIRNERLGNGNYIGRDIALSKTQAFHALKGAKELKGMELSPDDALFCQVLGMAYKYRTKFQPEVSYPSAEFNSVIDSDYLDKFHDDIDDMHTAEDVYELAKKILDESPEHSSEEEEQKAKDMKEQKEGGEEGEGKGDKSEGSDKEEGEGEGKYDKISYEDLLAHNHSEKGEPHSVEIVYDHDERDDYIPNTKHDIIDVKSNGRIDHDMLRYFEASSKMGGKFRRLLQARSQSLKSFRHTSGKLSGRDLYRVTNNEVDLFSRTQATTDLKNTAVYILTDGSGSMSGGKYSKTGASAALISDALTPVDVPHMISSFTEGRGTTKTLVIKRWSDRPSPRKIMDRYTTAGREMAQNADGESVLYAFKELMSRPEKRKILIVLSDGEPCADAEGDAYTHTKEVVKEVSKHVECYGIGIQTDSVKHFYPEFSVLGPRDSLQDCLIEVLKSKIIGAV